MQICNQILLNRPIDPCQSFFKRFRPHISYSKICVFFRSQFSFLLSNSIQFDSSQTDDVVLLQCYTKSAFCKLPSSVWSSKCERSCLRTSFAEQEWQSNQRLLKREFHRSKFRLKLLLQHCQRI